MSFSNTFASIVVGVLLGSTVRLFTGPVVEIPSFKEPKQVEPTRMVFIERQNEQGEPEYVLSHVEKQNAGAGRQIDKKEMSFIDGVTKGQFESFLDALAIVESGNNPSAVGDNGNAIGCYQIWRDYHADATEFSGLGGSYQDCFSCEYSRDVVTEFMKRYAKPSRVDRPITLKDLSFMHVGGPNAPWSTGQKLQNCEVHWNKVKNTMVQIRMDRLRDAFGSR